MPRRLLLSLRAWTGALLACAVFVCLAGAARPAMAMPMSRSMPMSSPVAMADTAMARHTAYRAERQASAVARVPDRRPDCPAADHQCVAPKVTLGQDSAPTHVPAAVSAVADCAPRVRAAWPHAPPPAASPPDLHRLCVSRT
ncbi:hypothetical protein [Streptomyces sp. NPDC096339]|uniref:hypothetical protein n=1 Tax=Streptomyces sp. NPDC096339 TaxID=3366086 RepID=UPI0037FD12B5